MLQEQQQQQQQWAGAHPNGPAVYHSSRPQGTGAWNPNQQQQPQSSGPNMGEFQEQFTKIAESVSSLSPPQLSTQAVLMSILHFSWEKDIRKFVL